MSWHSSTSAEIPAERSGSLTIPGYEVLQELGRGGMGVVYRARQIKADRVVALKLMLHAEHAGSSARARFDTEAQAVARLQHPNIVQVFEVSEVDGAPFFSLEFVAGGTLADKVKKSLLPEKEVVHLAIALARTLGYAHRCNIVHRDLKPGNVLLTPEGAPKIADFGLARKVEVETHLTQAGVVVGTPSYMAPEQASGNPDRVGPPADVYALGAILYELLTGRPPFQGATLFEVLEQVRTAEPVAPRALRPHVSRDLETICLKCLQKGPVQRYASADDLADDLERYQRGEPIMARPIGPLARMIRWGRRNPAPTALIVVALLAATISTTLALALRAQKNEIVAKNKEITKQNETILDQNRNITAQRNDLAVKERLATTRLELNRKLVTTFASEVPTIAHYHPLGDDLKSDLTELVVRLLVESRGKANVGTLTERGLLVLATRQGDLARIHKKLDEAQRHYGEALRLAELVVATEKIEKAKALSNLSFALIKQGELAQDRRRHAEAIGHYRQALALRQQLVDKPPSGELDPVDCQLDLGRAHRILAEAHFSAMDHTEALVEAEIGFKLLDKYAPAVTDKKRAEYARFDLGLAAILMGNLAFRANQIDKGRAAFERALAVFRAELTANPRSLAAHYYLSKVLSEYGDWCIMKLNRPDEALKYFKLAQNQNRALCDSPEVVNVMQTGLALGYYRLGLAAEKAGRTDEAQNYYRHCLDLREVRVREVEETSLGLPNSRRLLDARIDRMLPQARCGRVAEVTKMADNLLRVAASLEPRKARSPQWAAYVRAEQAHYQLFAGCGLAVLAGHVGPSHPQYASFITKAVEATRLAVANGFSNLWFLENDSDFDTIRPEPGYQTILASMRPKPAKPLGTGGKKNR